VHVLVAIQVADADPMAHDHFDLRFEFVSHLSELDLTSEVLLCEDPGMRVQLPRRANQAGNRSNAEQGRLLDERQMDPHVERRNRSADLNRLLKSRPIGYQGCRGQDPVSVGL